MMVKTYPPEYFATCQLDESLLLRFLYRPEQKQVNLVISYAAEIVSQAFELQAMGKVPFQDAPPPTDFRHFCLEEVRWLKINSQKWGAADDWAAYEKRLLDKPLVLTAVEQCHAAYDHRLSFGLGKFGRHRIQYSQLLIERRLATATRVDESVWKYYDMETQSEINFFDPFSLT